jgi:hypothetical protein
MSKRLFVIALCILFLPMLASISPCENSNVSGPALVAFAGHAQPGGESCTCGCPNCSCYPGEQPTCPNTNGVVGQPNDKLSGRGTPSSQVDYGTGVLVLALTLFVWLRLRA